MTYMLAHLWETVVLKYIYLLLPVKSFLRFPISHIIWVVLCSFMYFCILSTQLNHCSTTVNVWKLIKWHFLYVKVLSCCSLAGFLILYKVLGVHFILYRSLIARERERERARERVRTRSPLWKTDTSVCLYSVRHCCELISWKIKRWDSNKSFVNFYNPQTHWSMGINEDAWYCCRYEQGRWWGQ